MKAIAKIQGQLFRGYISKGVFKYVYEGKTYMISQYGCEVLYSAPCNTIWYEALGHKIDEKCLPNCLN